MLSPIPVYSQYEGGSASALNLSAVPSAPLKAGPGKVCRISIVTAGSGGALTLNDIDTQAGAAAANVITTIPNATLIAGAIIVLNWPFLKGLVVSAIPSGGVVLAISYN